MNRNHSWKLIAVCAPLVAACGTQYSDEALDQEFADMRVVVTEQRETIEDLQKEQERLRSALEKLQYRQRQHEQKIEQARIGATESDYWEPGSGQPTPGVSITGMAPGGRPTPGPMPTPEAGVASTPRPSAPAAAAAVPKPAPAPAAATPPASAPAIVAKTPAPDAAGTGAVPAGLAGTPYDNAVRSMQAGDYDTAVQNLRSFIHENPSSAHADDAQYLIGEAYYKRNQYHRAIIELNQVAITYGSGDKAAAALVRQAEAFRAVGDPVDARLSLQKVISRYPGSPEAQRASQLLAEME